LARTDVVTSWILSSVLTGFSRPVCSSSSKLSPSYAKRLCYLNTARRTLASSSETFR
jgi:hypothetical protein